MIDLAETLEPLLLRAWPAVESYAYDGWLHRASKGYTNRANSVHVTADPAHDLEEKLVDAARWYRQRGLPLQFRLHDSGPSARLDERLPAMYSRHSETLVMCAPITKGSDGPGITAATSPSQEWLAAKRDFGGFRSGSAGRWEQIIERITPPVSFCTVTENRVVAAIGMLVVDGTWACVLDVMVDPARRRAGFGSRLMSGMLDTVADSGATHCHLQVEATNRPARALYERLDFEVGYRYWYRLSDSV